MILGNAQPFASPAEALQHVSETPWSEYSKADYTLEQWHAACLIHIHDGNPTSKSECKLPVKTPDGALNRNGVHAAAAALAGARGGLKNVSADQKKKAGIALKRYYAQLDEDAPESLAEHSALEHYGVKGMHWGVRKEDDRTGREAAKTVVEKNDSTKAYMTAAAGLQVEAARWSPEKKAANVEKYREDFAKKFQASDGKESASSSKSDDPGALAKAKEKWAGLSDEQKHAVVQVGLAAAIVGGVVAYNQYASRYSLPMSAYLPMQDNPNIRPGQNIKLGEFISRIQKSQESTNSVENFFRPEAFARESFTLPVGHTFHRISDVAETGFSQATYCTASGDDFNRYAVALGVTGSKKHHLTFQSTAPVKVPSLSEVLDTVREQMGKDYGYADSSKIPERNVLDRYKSISHQQWKGQESLSLIESLKKKGFGAIVDEMDAGVFSNKPLVLFSNDVSSKKATVMKRSDLKESLKQLKEIDKPPGRAGYGKPKAGPLVFPNLGKQPNMPNDLANLVNLAFA